MHTAIILSSGSGKRMGALKNKVLLKIKGKPIIFYTLSAFEKNPHIKRIIITTGKDEIETFSKIVKDNGFRKVSDIISGGEERQHSAFNALRHIKENYPSSKGAVVSFHNGANPFVAQEDISGSILNAIKHGACAVAHRTKDTIKEVNEKDLVEKTLERKKLWNMQTPQSIRFDLAMKAFNHAFKNNFLGTDDVSLVERLGKKVKIIEGSPYNFKITTPLDLELAKIILDKYYV